MPLGDGEAGLQLKNDVPTQLCVDDVEYPPILYSVSFGQLKNGRRKALAVTWSLRVVHGVSKVCQVSQLYPAINDLHGYQRAEINDTTLCLQCRLLVFFLMAMS